MRNFSVPDDGPAPIPDLAEVSYSRYERTQEATSQLAAARKAIVAGQAEDIREAADAIAAGKEPAKEGKHEAAAVAEVKRLERLIAAANLAEHEAALELSHAVAEHAAAWRKMLTPQLAKAEANFRAALAALRDAGRELAVVRGSIDFLDEHDVFHPSGFRAPGIIIPERIGDANSRPSVASIVQALEKVVDPEVQARYGKNARGRQVHVERTVVAR